MEQVHLDGGLVDVIVVHNSINTPYYLKEKYKGIFANGVISIGGARCISVLSSFVRLKKEISFTKEDAMPYIDSYMNTCLGKDQTAFRVQDTSKERRMCRIPCEQVFEEIFDGKIDELITGNLKYI